MKYIKLALVLMVTLSLHAKADTGASIQAYVEHFRQFTRMKKVETIFEKTIHEIGSEKIFGKLAILVIVAIGICATIKGCQKLCQDTKDLFSFYKRFENNEKIKINYKKLPRQIAEYIVAKAASMYGFTAVYTGLNLFCRSLKSK